MTIFRFILLALIVYAIFKWIWKDDKSSRKNPPVRHGDQAVEEMKRDPVCGTYVPVSLAVTLTGEKETLYFCSDGCREKFKQIQKKR